MSNKIEDKDVVSKILDCFQVLEHRYGIDILANVDDEIVVYVDGEEKFKLIEVMYEAQ